MSNKTVTDSLEKIVTDPVEETLTAIDSFEATLTDSFEESLTVLVEETTFNTFVGETVTISVPAPSVSSLLCLYCFGQHIDSRPTV
jgi:hypothetical protein